ncbi:MAG: PASTA domain-containing protein [Rhodothermales bacterium]
MPRLPKFLAELTQDLRSLVSNKYFWGGFAGLLVIFLVVYIVVDDVIMPGYTRHGVAVKVPNVVNQPFEQAKTELEANELDVHMLVQRFNPNFPRDVVVDQNPPPNATVKPGRNVYLTVNSGELQKVAVPGVGGLSLREAVNRLRARGLEVSETLPDSIPAPNPNTVTRQSPAPGDSVNEGASVRLWYSTGLGQEYVTIPDLVGLSLEEAQQTLLDSQLRYIVIGADEGEDTSEAVVHRQSRDPGTRVPAGFEVRIYLDEEPPLEGEEDQE